MRGISFNKASTLCLYCKENRVDIKRWNKPCDKCKEKYKVRQRENLVNIGKALPAAVISGTDGSKRYVDKHGNEVDNPGYDLSNDPRGWKFTGTVKEEPKIV